MYGYLLLCVGLAFAALGAPLARGRVAPNRAYGFRTPTTLADERVWYPANRATGWALLTAGVVLLCLGALVVLGVVVNAAWVVLAALPAAGLATVLAGARAARRATDVVRAG